MKHAPFAVMVAVSATAVGVHTGFEKLHLAILLFSYFEQIRICQDSVGLVGDDNQSIGMVGRIMDNIDHLPEWRAFDHAFWLIAYIVIAFCTVVTRPRSLWIENHY